MKLKKDFTIRFWKENDFLVIRKLLGITWLKTYSFIPEKDLSEHLNRYYSFEQLESLFNDKNYFCYSVENKDEIIGWMKLFDNQDEGKFYVSSLYVLPNYQGNGIGKELMNIAESKARELKHSDIWIGVMEQNENTLNWYKKLGFNFIKAEPFKMGETEVSHLIGYKKLNL